MGTVNPWDNLSNERNRWALLIGIDFYSPGPHLDLQPNDLAGCVDDVEHMETYIKERLRVPAAQITKLISPAPSKESYGRMLGNLVSWWYSAPIN